MNKLYIYFFLGLVALPLAGFSGGMITSEKVHAATKSGKKGSSATFYGRLWVQYDNADASDSDDHSPRTLFVSPRVIPRFRLWVCVGLCL